MRITKNTKLLFLDFDGVLNSYEEGSYKTNTNETYGPSKTICEKIKSLCDRNGAKIILSTNWRKFALDGWYSFKESRVQNPIMKLYPLLGEYIIGLLPPYRHITKSEALILWIEENNYNGKNWVVLDDDPREGFGTTHDYDIKNHYIQTNPEFGITDEIIERMENLLNMPF